MWDELAGREHPGWRIVSPETGGHVRQHASPTGAGWVFMDLASPYLDYLCRQIEETVTLFGDADGIFIDITFQLDSVSPWVQTRMEAQGLDWTDAEHRLKFTEQVTFEFFERTNKTVRKHAPKNADLLQLRPCPSRAPRHAEVFHAPRDGIASDRELGL